jgi:hypothetical protein
LYSRTMILESELYSIFYLAKDFTCFLGGGEGGNVLFCSAPASKSQLDFISQLVFPRVGRGTTFYIFVRYRFMNGLKYHK